MKLAFTPRAVHDLKRLRAFIAEHNSDAASRISQRLKRSIQHLVQNPELGKVVDELPAIRDFITGPYLVRYTVTKGSIIILKIWHGKEDQ
jgi:plasmid stabilization system protein ParE